MVFFCLALGGCAATAPSNPPLAISYHWEPTAPLPSFDNRPPEEISIRWEPGTLSPSQLEQLEYEQCLAWNRQPSPVERRDDTARFRCDKPLPRAPTAD